MMMNSPSCIRFGVRKNEYTLHTYNYLNRPEVITVDGREITYVYDAAGNRLQKRVLTNAPNNTAPGQSPSSPTPYEHTLKNSTAGRFVSAKA